MKGSMMAKKLTKVGFVSLGCPKNLVDSEVMLGTLAQHGYEITHSKQDADVLVVNTCGFIDSAKQESIDTILEMAELKSSGSCQKLVVAGCLAERYRSDIIKQIPEIDFVFGPDELGKILEAVRIGDEPLPDISIDSLYTSREIPTIPRILSTPGYMAYLKISEGCDHVCSFCAIPGFRGKFRSRPVRDLVAESRRLADQGVRELVLVSQDTMAYGKDLGMEDGITSLLRQLAELTACIGCGSSTATRTQLPRISSVWSPKKRSSVNISTFRISMPAAPFSIECCEAEAVKLMSGRSSASANSTRMPGFAHHLLSGFRVKPKKTSRKSSPSSGTFNSITWASFSIRTKKEPALISWTGKSNAAPPAGGGRN
jgi:hypothetical protein